MREADTSRTRRCGHICTALISRNEDHTRANDSWRGRGAFVEGKNEGKEEGGRR